MPSDSPKPSRRSNSKVRLQKYLAECGLGSRRYCEKLIGEGRVSIDGHPVEEQGVSVIPGQERVEVDGKPVLAKAHRYLLMNKPRDCICTADDPQGRRTVFDLLPGNQERLFTVGRLDRQSEGLLILTNDGDFSNALAHPSRKLEKVYRVWSTGELTPSIKKQFLDGIIDEGEVLKAVGVRSVEDPRGHCIELTLHEGRNRQVRRMYSAVGLKVRRLLRVRIGPIRLKGLKSGSCRELTPEERALLLRETR